MAGRSEAIRIVARGDALLAPTAARRLIADLVRRQPADPTRLNQLIQRDRVVLHAIATGQNNHEIAEHLFISAGTVKAHISRLLTKLRARDRVQLVITAYHTGLA